MTNKRTLVAILALACLVILTMGYLWQAGYLSRGGAVEKITIGTHLNGMNGLLFIAKTEGFDRQQGLDLTIESYGTGRDAAREVSAGRRDFACCAEFVLVKEIFAGTKNLRIIGVLSSGDIHMIIARRDKGITRPEDLRGKIIGVPLGTSAEFYLARFLTFKSIPLNEVTLVDLNPPNLAEALATGGVDAVLAWEPEIYDILKRVGKNAIQWPAQEGQDFYWLLVSRPEVIKTKMAVVEKLYRALGQAAGFAREKPGEVKKIIAQWTKVPLADLQAGRFPVMYGLFLDQGLLLAMEDQARWMINERFTDKTRVPNYLAYLDAEPLRQVDPRAVRLKIPAR